jgi:hypothetical protein
MSLKHWLQQVAVGNRRSAERRLLQGFGAAYPLGLELKHGVVHDISATGIYVRTSDRLQPGTIVPLMVHRVGSQASGGPANLVNIESRVVRSDDEGAAFTFEMLPRVDRQLWTGLVDAATNDSAADDIIAPFKLAKTLAFFTQICAPYGAHVRQHICASLAGQRLWNAVEIALKAESLWASRPDRGDLLCDHSLALRILDDGSWTESETIRNDWAGLLASSCSLSSNDQSNSAFVELFSQLTVNHMRIVDEVCAHSEKYFTPDGQIASRPFIASSDEIMLFSDSRDLLRMGRALQHLSELGLLEERFKTSMFVPVDEITITPTSLGLQLYARCAGHPGPPESFYGVSPTVAQSAV